MPTLRLTPGLRRWTISSFLLIIFIWCLVSVQLKLPSQLAAADVASVDTPSTYMTTPPTAPSSTVPSTSAVTSTPSITATPSRSATVPTATDFPFVLGDAISDLEERLHRVREPIPQYISPPLNQIDPLLRNDKLSGECDKIMSATQRMHLGTYAPVAECFPHPGAEAVESRVRYMRNTLLSWDREEMVDMENVVVDFGKISIHTKPDWRGIPNYQRGAIEVWCESGPNFNAKVNQIESFSCSNHVQSAIGTGMAVLDQPQCDKSNQHVTRPTLLFTREGTTGSQWHNMMELIGLYTGAVASNLTNALDDFQVVIMDGHHYIPSGQGAGNLVPLLQTLTAYPVVDSRSFGSDRVCFDRVIYPVPGWNTYFWQNVWGGEKCLAPSPLLLSFRNRILKGLGIIGESELLKEACQPDEKMTAPSNKPLKLLYLARAKGKRGLENEAEVLTSLKTIESVNAESVLLTHAQTVAEQITIIRDADIILSMHGAALVNTIFARPLTGVVEILPLSHARSHYYDNIAAFTCLTYQSINGRQGQTADNSVVDVNELTEIVKQVAEQILSKRKLHTA